MKKILVSLSVIVAVGAVVAGATGAFFSDTETSTGNTFTAGAIDLQIDNESYAIDYNIPGYKGPDDRGPVGNFVASTHTSWQLTDLTVEKFFDFIDLKPGDFGEDTISIHVRDNDAWLCAAARVTDDNDVNYTEPEEDDDSTVDTNNPTTTDGELDESLNFVFWADDGDNVLEHCRGVELPNQQECVDETLNIIVSGTLADLGAGGQIALADAQGGVLGGGNPIPGGETFYIGKAWCFGELSEDAVEQDGLGGGNNNSPLVRGTGIDCDGSQVNNAAQTDTVVGDIQFYAEQSRNNGSFECAVDYTPVWPQPNDQD